MVGVMSEAHHERLCKLKSAVDVDFLREGVHLLSERLMELVVNANVGLARHERRKQRSGQHNDA